MRRNEATLPDEELAEEIAPVLRRGRKDMREAVETLSEDAARYLVDLYYNVQSIRIGQGNRVSAIQRGDAELQEPHSLLLLMQDSLHMVEKNIATMMDLYTDRQVVSRWAKSQYGIGPVLAAGLIAYIPITPEKTTSVSQLWSFAGLNPNMRWEEGQRRPFNARLKTHCWRIGTSFWKLHKKDPCFYGHIMAERKALEIARNLSGTNKDEAARTLQVKDFSRRVTVTRTAYEEGRLPDGRVQLRAQRYAVKIFLAHWWIVARESKGMSAGKPYILSVDPHSHYVPPPNWPMVVEEKKKKAVSKVSPD